MKILKQILSSCLLVILLFAVGVVIEAEEEEEPQVGIEIGDKAPDFTLKNLAEKKIKLSDFKGRYVLLNFWATWCPPCRAEMPDLNEFHLENKEDFVVVAVNVRDKKTRVEEFMKYNNYQFPILLDETGNVSRRYRISAIPTSYFLDPEGKIKYIVRGAMNLERLKEIKQKITEEE